MYLNVPNAWESRGTAIDPHVPHIFFVPEDLVMKIFLRPFFLFRWFKKSNDQLMVKECALSTGNLLRGGLPRSSVDRITDRPDMTLAVDRGRKALTQPTNPNFNGCIMHFCMTCYLSC